MKRTRRKTISGVTEFQASHDSAFKPPPLSNKSKSLPTAEYNKIRQRSGSTGNLKKSEKPMSGRDIENSLREVWNIFGLYSSYSRTSNLGRDIYSNSEASIEIESSYLQIYNWIVGPGEGALQKQLHLGDCIAAVQELLKIHSELSKKASVILSTLLIIVVFSVWSCSLPVVITVSYQDQVHHSIRPQISAR